MKQRLLKAIKNFFRHSPYDYYALGEGREADSFFLENATVVTAFSKDGVHSIHDVIPFSTLTIEELRHITDHVIGSIEKSTLAC